MYKNSIYDIKRDKTGVKEDDFKVEIDEFTLKNYQGYVSLHLLN